MLRVIGYGVLGVLLLAGGIYCFRDIDTLTELYRVGFGKGTIGSPVAVGITGMVLVALSLLAFGAAVLASYPYNSDR